MYYMFLSRGENNAAALGIIIITSNENSHDLFAKKESIESINTFRSEDIDVFTKHVADMIKIYIPKKARYQIFLDDFC